MPRSKRPTRVWISTSARWARTIAIQKKRAKIEKAAFRANVKKVISDRAVFVAKGMNAPLDFMIVIQMLAAW